MGYLLYMLKALKNMLKDDMLMVSIYSLHVEIILIHRYQG